MQSAAGKDIMISPADLQFFILPYLRPLRKTETRYLGDFLKSFRTPQHLYASAAHPMPGRLRRGRKPCASTKTAVPTRTDGPGKGTAVFQSSFSSGHW